MTRITTREEKQVSLTGIVDESQNRNSFYALEFMGDQEWCSCVLLRYVFLYLFISISKYPLFSYMSWYVAAYIDDK